MQTTIREGFAPVSVSKQKKMWMRKHLQESDLFSSFSDRSLSGMMKDIEHFDVLPGDTIITQGEVGDMLYVIESGEYVVMVDGKKVAKLRRKGQIFGELALMSDQPRTATIVAAKPGTLWCLDRARWKQHKRIHEDEMNAIEDERRRMKEMEEALSDVPSVEGQRPQGKDPDGKGSLSKRDSWTLIERETDNARVDTASKLIMKKTMAAFRRSSIDADISDDDKEGNKISRRRRSTKRRISIFVRDPFNTSLTTNVPMRRQSSIKRHSGGLQRVIQYHRCKSALELLQLHPTQRHPGDVETFARELYELLRSSQDTYVRRTTQNQCKMIMADAAGLKYRNSHLMFGEGGQGRRAFIVLKGKISLSVKRTVVSIVEKGGIVGETRAFSEGSRYLCDARVVGGSVEAIVLTDNVLKRLYAPWMRTINRDINVARSSAILSSCSRHRTMFVLKLATLRTYESGQLVACQGTRPFTLMIVRSGSCVMWHTDNSSIVRKAHKSLSFERHRPSPTGAKTRQRRAIRASSSHSVARESYRIFLCPRDDARARLVSSLAPGSCVGSEVIRDIADDDEREDDDVDDKRIDNDDGDENNEHSNSRHVRWTIPRHLCMISACSKRSRKVAVEFWCLKPNLVSDRILGYAGTTNKVRRFMRTRRNHYADIVDRECRSRAKMAATISSRLPPLSTSHDNVSTPPTDNSMATRVAQRLEKMFGDKSTEKKVERSQGVSQVRGRRDKSLPSFNEMERNEPIDTTQALLMLEVQSRDMADDDRFMYFGNDESDGADPPVVVRREKFRPLPFAAANTGRLMLLNLEHRRRREEQDAKIATRTKNVDVASRRTTQGKELLRRSLAKRVSAVRCFPGVYGNSLHEFPHSNRRSGLAKLWARGRRGNTGEWIRQKGVKCAL